jgi:hypothetical protein
MSYTVPRSLEVLVGVDVISKYQRVFTFVLRLIRGVFYRTWSP